MGHLPSPFRRIGSDSRTLERAVHLALGAVSLLLCWRGIGWAIQPGAVLVADEIGNLHSFIGKSYAYGLTVLPQLMYNDRPVGVLFERVLFAHFGFDYTASLGWFLPFHFANLALAYLLFRRIGVGAALSIAGVAVLGCLSTTAQSASYIGASFDVICTFFLLAGMLSLLAGGWRGTAASAAFFFLALRTKEFAIAAPVLFTLLLICTERRLSMRTALASAARRLWPHYAIAAIFAVRYATLLPSLAAEVGTSGPYSIDVNASTILASLSYYTALIFGAEGLFDPGWRFLPLLGLGAILTYGLVRRRAAVLFSLSCYAVLLLPVSVLPHIRAPYYVYGPQIFLMAAGCLAIEEIAGAIFKGDRPQWMFKAGAALALMLLALLHSQGAYFHNRAAFGRMVRSTAARTARDAAATLYGVGPGAHVYLNHGQETPWLFTAGPCDFLSLLNRETVTCIFQKPESELLSLYERDPEEKYFVDYFSDGSLKVRKTAAAHSGRRQAE